MNIGGEPYIIRKTGHPFFATRDELVDACRNLSDRQAKQAMRTRIMPFIIMPGKIYYVTAGKNARKMANRLGLEVVAIARQDDMVFAFQKVFSCQILHNSRFHLKNAIPAYSAARRFTAIQIMVLTGLTGLVLYLWWFSPDLVVIAFSLGISLIFLSVTAIRLSSVITDNLQKSAPVIVNRRGPLPVYTIFVPLFKEAGVIDQLLAGLDHLNYPKDRLDIKLILEASDHQTINCLRQYTLPDYYEIIMVPDALPRTKPKAMNYALPFARGSYAVIYDAEDIPQPDQLLYALGKFAASPPEIVCLQARLTYYNANENWLTRQFTIEYAVLFDLLLPMLAAHHAPLPLGGTSNHFRMEALRQLGGWDPFNVTEDADLGMRLARFGWRAAMLESDTFEEAANSGRNWMMQRARWLKGWMQTWLVHMRNPIRTAREMGLMNFLFFQILVAGIVVSTLSHPLFLVATIIAIVNGTMLSFNDMFINNLVSASGVIVFITGYAVMIWAGFRAVNIRRLSGLRWQVLYMPVYWLLMSVAGWLALWQFISSPFHWNKTRHGLSRIRPRR